MSGASLVHDDLGMGESLGDIAHATRMFLKVAEMAVKDCDEDGIVA